MRDVNLVLHQELQHLVKAFVSYHRPGVQTVAPVKEGVLELRYESQLKNIIRAASRARSIWPEPMRTPKLPRA